MKNQTHQFFSLYKRKDSPSIYAQFWADAQNAYASGRSTGKTTLKEAEFICQTWISEFGGLPQIEKKQQEISKEQLVTYMTSFIRDRHIIEEEQSIGINELLSSISLILTGSDMNADNPIFIDYLLQFWDWDSSLYIKDKLDSGQRIGETYSRANRRYIENYAVAFFGDRRIRSITTNLLEQFKSYIPRFSEINPNGLKPRSINAITGCVGTALEEAMRLGIINDNPAPKMRRLASTGTNRGILTPEEIHRVLSMKWVDERTKVASQLSACHGLRAGEIGALCIQDLDFEANIIHVRGSWERRLRVIKSTKNGHERIIYTDKIIMDSLKAIYEQNPHHMALSSGTARNQMSLSIWIILGTTFRMRWLLLVSVLTSRNDVD